MLAYKNNVMPMKRLQCVCVFVLVTAAACNGSETPTGNAVYSDGSEGGGSAELSLNSNSSLIATTEQDLYKMSAQDGSTDLVFAGGGGDWEFLSPVDVVENVAYISSTSNSLSAISLDTGQLLWERLLDDADEEGYPTVPSCSASSCYIVSGAYSLYGIGTTDGDLQWAVSLDMNEGAIQAVGNRHPLITEDKIYIATDYADGSYWLNVFSRIDGSFLKTIEFEDQIFGTPVVSDGKMLVVAGRSLHALDFETHQLIWRTEFSGLSIPVVIGQMVVAAIHDPENRYVDTEYGTAGMNVSTGEVVWANSLPLDVGGILPASDGSLVISATHPGSSQPYDYPTYPRALNPVEGSVVWDLGTTGVTSDTPLAVPGHLFYRSMNRPRSGFGRGVTAIDSRSGETIWIATDGYADNVQKGAGSLVLVHDGQVYRTEEFPTTSK